MVFYGVPTAPSPRATGQQRNSVLYHPQKLWPNKQTNNSTTVHGPILIENPPRTDQQYQYEQKSRVPTPTQQMPTTIPQSYKPTSAPADAQYAEIPTTATGVHAERKVTIQPSPTSDDDG